MRSSPGQTWLPLLAIIITCALGMPFLLPGNKPVVREHVNPTFPDFVSASDKGTVFADTMYSFHARKLSLKAGSYKLTVVAGRDTSTIAEGRYYIEGNILTLVRTNADPLQYKILPPASFTWNRKRSYSLRPSDIDTDDTHDLGSYTAGN